MSGFMKIDIVICTFNRAEKLRKALRSILDCDAVPGAAVRILVVDNNSSDATRSVVEAVMADSPLEITYLFEKKPGKSMALNAALDHVSGDLIAFTDDDVTVCKGWIAAMADALERHPAYGCFGGRVRVVYPPDMPEWINIQGTLQFLRSAFVDNDAGDEELDFCDNPFSKTPGGVNMFFRRQVVADNGPFRTDLGPRGRDIGFSEDTEYCRRLLEKGERFLYVPQAVVYHPIHEERMNRQYLLDWQYKCARSEVRRVGGYRNVGTVLGVPKYLLSKVFRHAVGYGLSFRKRERFYHQLRLYYTSGEILEHIKLSLESHAT